MTEPSILATSAPAIISALSGISGALLGALVVWWKESRFIRVKDERDTQYLANLVVAHLERFGTGCTYIAFDDGMTDGSPSGGDGAWRECNFKGPNIEPLDIEVEWKLLLLRRANPAGSEQNWGRGY